MRSNGRLDNFRMHATRFSCACCLAALAMCSYAQTINPETYVGRLFWYEPSHDKYVPTEFSSSPSPSAAKTRFPGKMRVLVVAAQKGWFTIRVGQVGAPNPTVYMPINVFISRVYRPRAGTDPNNANAEFMRASLFDEDPDNLKKQFEPKEPDPAQAPAVKPSTKLKPWQKYKENWGSVATPPKKNKNLLLDPIKPAEGPDSPP